MNCIVMPVKRHLITRQPDHIHAAHVQQPVLTAKPRAVLSVEAYLVSQWMMGMKWTCILVVDATPATILVAVDVYKNSQRICNCQKFYYLCKMKQYKNQQISDNLKEVTDITKQVCVNTRGIRLTVSPISTEVMTVTDLVAVLDVGEEFSFFYTSIGDALEDQALLCTHLRIRGMSIAKVHKQEPISIKNQ